MPEDNSHWPLSPHPRPGMRRIVASDGRLHEYPAAIERELRAMTRYNHGFYVDDIEEWIINPPSELTLRRIVAAVAGVLALQFQVGVKLASLPNGGHGLRVYRKKRGGPSVPPNARVRRERPPGRPPQETSKFRWESLRVGEVRQFKAKQATVMTSWLKWSRVRGLHRKWRVKSTVLPDGMVEVWRLI
jgi:hypothetical protein